MSERWKQTNSFRYRPRRRRANANERIVDLLFSFFGPACGSWEKAAKVLCDLLRFLSGVFHFFLFSPPRYRVNTWRTLSEKKRTHTRKDTTNTHTHRGRKEKKTKESHERGDGNQVRSARLRTSKWRRVLKKPGPCPPATGFDRRKWRWGKERERENKRRVVLLERERKCFQLVRNNLTFRLAERRSTDELCGNGFFKKTKQNNTHQIKENNNNNRRETSDRSRLSESQNGREKVCRLRLIF